MEPNEIVKAPMERLTEKTIGCFEYHLKDHKPEVGEFGTYDAFFDFSMAVRLLAKYEETGLTPEEIEHLQSELEASQRQLRVAVEDIYNAAPCFACTHFKRNRGACFGAGVCRYKEPQMSQYPNGFEWRGAEQEGE